MPANKLIDSAYSITIRFSTDAWAALKSWCQAAKKPRTSVTTTGSNAPMMVLTAYYLPVSKHEMAQATRPLHQSIQRPLGLDRMAGWFSSAQALRRWSA
jgi:hypothetical protein